jgi:hypothetical protein
MKTPRAKTPKLKRREQATPARRHRSSAADLQKQLDQRTRELAVRMTTPRRMNSRIVSQMSS